MNSVRSSLDLYLNVNLIVNLPTAFSLRWKHINSSVFCLEYLITVLLKCAVVLSGDFIPVLLQFIGSGSVLVLFTYTQWLQFLIGSSLCTALLFMLSWLIASSSSIHTIFFIFYLIFFYVLVTPEINTSTFPVTLIAYYLSLWRILRISWNETSIFLC